MIQNSEFKIILFPISRRVIPRKSVIARSRRRRGNLLRDVRRSKSAQCHPEGAQATVGIFL